MQVTGTSAKLIAEILSARNRSGQAAEKQNFEKMLGKAGELRAFPLRNRDLRTFSEKARNYGLEFFVLKNGDSPDGISHILCRSEWASKAARIIIGSRLEIPSVAEVQSSLSLSLSTDENRENSECSDTAAQEEKSSFSRPPAAGSLSVPFSPGQGSPLKEKPEKETKRSSVRRLLKTLAEKLPAGNNVPVNSREMTGGTRIIGGHGSE